MFGGHTHPYGQQGVGSAINSGIGKDLHRCPHHGQRGRRQSRRHHRHQRGHGLTDRTRDIQRFQRKGHERCGRDRRIHAPDLPQGRPLIINGRHLPDHAAQRKKDNERIQPSILDERRAQKDSLGIGTDGPVRLGIQNFQCPDGKIRGVRIKTRSANMGIMPQATGQLGHKGSAFRLCCLQPQTQRCRAHKKRPDQRPQGQQLQSGQKQPGQPAMTWQHALHKNHDLPVDLQKQQDDSQQNDDGKNLKKMNKG